MSALSTPAFLVDEGGVLVFYNEAAGMMLGKRFEELGTVVRSGRPAHAEYEIHSTDGASHAVEVSAFPILTAHGSQGGIAIFWPTATNGNGARPA
jgi:PAS domain-containing protein